MSGLLENVSRIEPCHLAELPAAIADRVVELYVRAARLERAVPPQAAAELAQLVQVMNCYYSNLIEGHNTRPRDIERALQNQFDEAGRDLQLEARAHIRVQAHIDEMWAAGALPDAASVTFIRQVHREFYEGAPERLLRIEHVQGDYLMAPGEFRSEAKHEVVVGRHQPPSGHRVGEFMRYFEQRCSVAGMGPANAGVMLAVAHHRFNYIHPFPDGNGRVSRLMSHAMALQAGVGARGLWSISRGLARGLKGPWEYKAMMDLADTPRQGDLDGRGNLSLKALHEFVEWFLDVALDQVQFMTSLFDFEGLRTRLETYVLRDLGLRAECAKLVHALLVHGELSRGDAATIMNLKPRTASDTLRRLVDSGLVTSQSQKGKLGLHFGAAAADVLFPRLFLTDPAAR